MWLVERESASVHCIELSLAVHILRWDWITEMHALQFYLANNTWVLKLKYSVSDVFLVQIKGYIYAYCTDRFTHRFNLTFLSAGCQHELTIFYDHWTARDCVQQAHHKGQRDKH